ncbi:MAG: fused MFS/spermidine synthase [Myxococcota bacterium]
MIRYAVTIFLSAFLLFQVQPIAGRMVLPWFGGSASVWNACLVFFQTTLLFGYLYAHWLNEKLSPRKQAIIHTMLLLASLALLPIAASPPWKDVAARHPTLGVLGILGATVGLPYFMVSTTGPLVQAWYARSFARGMPYRLYALSNVASMLALLSYPIFFEPRLTLGAQRNAWSVGYAIFALLSATTAWLAARSVELSPASTHEAATVPRPRPREIALWVLLPACASILLLAITRHITQDVAPVPFLWIVPLSLYLLSFIICFELPRLYHRPTFLVLLVSSFVAVAYALAGGFYTLTTVVVLSLSTFTFSMFCHGELVRRKPHPRHLTLFYLAVSFGGALGGMLVGLVAPLIFNSFVEFPLGLLLCAALVALVLWAKARPAVRGLLIVGTCAYGIWLGWIARDYFMGYRRVVRNFYAQLRVEETEVEGYGARRKLYHGRITHGEQFMAPELRTKATAYYCPETGVGRLLLSLDAGRPHRIGVVGLGAGTLAAYGRKGDTVLIYEINDQVLDLARSEFTYLGDSPATVVPVLGDARLSLEAAPSERLDVLVIDAFSGDAIPVHLLTLEAVETYLRHLRPDGVLAMHITNNTLDLRPVVASAAEHFGKTATIDSFRPSDDDWFCRTADWMLISSPERALTLPTQQVVAPTPDFRPWTDDYSNLLRILKQS